MYKYVVYNYILCSNYMCDYLTTVDESREYERKMIRVKISLCDLASKETNFTYQCTDNMFIGNWHGTSFTVDFENFIISITAPSVEIAFLIVLNIPLSLLLLSEHKIILHCSCAIDPKGLYAFSGNKGEGKSTICSVFAANNRAVFSDDTICIDTINESIYSNNTIEKYLYNTVSFLEEITKVNNLVKNEYNDKFIKKLDAHNATQNLAKLNLFFLFRGADFYCKKISNISVKKSLILNNIVGYKYANTKIKNGLLKCIDELLTRYDLNVQILFVPDIESNSVNIFQKKLENILI